MDISIRHVGSSIVEMTIEYGSATIVADVTDMQGIADEQLIENLRSIADELEQHNEERRGVCDSRQ